MTERERLERMGFIIGPRDSRTNTNYPGRYMVAEAYTEDELPTEDGSNGPWAIVGDDLDELIVMAAEAWPEEKRF